jgi:hypothetical protein
MAISLFIFLDDKINDGQFRSYCIFYMALMALLTGVCLCKWLCCLLPVMLLYSCKQATVSVSLCDCVAVLLPVLLTPLPTHPLLMPYSRQPCITSNGTAACCVCVHTIHMFLFPFSHLAWPSPSGLG